jgi:hypothetical protein
VTTADYRKRLARVRARGQAIAAARGMEYLIGRLPKAVPTGRYLVHNHVRPIRVLGMRGFRAWLQTDLKNDWGSLEPCTCGWAPELGQHYRVKGIPERAGS